MLLFIQQLTCTLCFPTLSLIDVKLRQMLQTFAITFIFTQIKIFSVKPLSVKWIASVLSSRYLLKIVQFMQVSFCDNLFRFKNKNVIHQPRSVHIGKNCAYCLVYRSRPQVLGHNFFSNTDRRRMENNTHLSFSFSLCSKLTKVQTRNLSCKSIESHANSHGNTK